MGEMDAAGRDDAEERVRTLLAAGDRSGATTAALRAQGPEVCGFLVGPIGRRDGADEVFARQALKKRLLELGRKEGLVGGDP